MTDLAHTFSTDWNMTSLKRTGRVFVSAVADTVKRWQYRREIRQLAEFDDRMLKDVGLTRSEVEGALAEPFFNHRAASLVRWNERQSHRLG